MVIVTWDVVMVRPAIPPLVPRAITTARAAFTGSTVTTGARAQSRLTMTTSAPRLWGRPGGNCGPVAGGTGGRTE